ncbi:uncharacterized protein BDZ83DRAFT_754456 [Colletotrichum acutatum]|uniref:Secreted protein n=1 Tax=Glomerella acutata TaxID=27357 RepID=A0AAD8UG84_GLOAC|nr:uncharacterized protein BDZ83DRAFT_754456 [Colletotrichum acutatum]KAK1722317.1 hypothetical protein BDZ83DRAFT_754456 [Colletotrichum acutatum]
MTWSMAWLFLALAACMHSAGFASGVATSDASKWIRVSRDGRHWLAVSVVAASTSYGHLAGLPPYQLTGR